MIVDSQCTNVLDTINYFLKLPLRQQFVLVHFAPSNGEEHWVLRKITGIERVRAFVLISSNKIPLLGIKHILTTWNVNRVSINTRKAGCIYYLIEKQV